MTTIAAQLPSLIGKTVYAAAFSILYLPSTSLDELLHDNRSQRILPTEIPIAQPLTITIAKYDKEKDVVVLKLETSSGVEYLALSRFLTMPDKQTTFLEQIALDVRLVTMPTMQAISPRKMKGVRKGAIFVGMSKFALEIAIGFPEHENDWGRGGKQLVYSNGEFLVYLNANNRVVNWQEFNRK